MLFKDVIGQTAVKQRLIQSVNEDRISHAQLFAGQQGNGKLALAIAFAQYIMCTRRTDADACGECPSCRKYKKLVHPDLHFSFPVASTQSSSKKAISDDLLPKWREIILDSPYINFDKWLYHIEIENKQAGIQKDEAYSIIRKLSLKSVEAEYKVVIMWLPEKMNESAANKLLKIVEEPPPKTVFIMVSEMPEVIIKTILSRTQIIQIPKIELDDMIVALKENDNLNADDARRIARIANGNYIEAQKAIAISEDDKENFELFANLMRLSYGKKMQQLVEWAEEVARMGRERQKRFFIYATRMLRENFVLNKAPEHQNELAYLANEEAEFSGKFSKYITDSAVFAMNEEFDKARFHIERNGYANLVLLDMVIKIVQIFRLVNP